MEALTTIREPGDDIFYIDVDTDFVDRFAMSKFMEFSLDTYISINSFFLHKFKELPVAGYYKVRFEKYRAETVSYVQFNGNEDLWWLICYYNGISWKDILPGTLLKMFSLSDFEKLTLKISEKQVLRAT